MIHSMTGFGDARLDVAGYSYHVEIRSVNNRYLKISTRVPEDCTYLEPEVERWVRARLARGSVTYNAKVRELGASVAQHVNADVVRAYVEQLRAVLGPETHVTIDAASLLALPGALEPHDLSEAERTRHEHTLERLTGEALDRLIEMRRVEGEALAQDLTEHCKRVRRSLAVIRARAPLVVTEYRDRLQARIQQLLAESAVQLAAEDLLREVSIYAERSDISEELSRLEGHVEQFEQAMRLSEPPGRKLEFIAQEMLREANTIGSKASDTAIAREIVEVKSAVDRIKEQVQNAE